MKRKNYLHTKFVKFLKENEEEQNDEVIDDEIIDDNDEVIDDADEVIDELLEQNYSVVGDCIAYNNFKFSTLIK